MSQLSISLHNRRRITLNFRSSRSVHLATSPTAPRRARFDRFTVDFRSCELLCSGVPVPIQSQPFQVLRLLLEAQGNVVTREEIRNALWPQDTFVDFELGMNTAVKKLRQALEDSAERPRFIETLPKVGYRFSVAVELATDVSPKTSVTQLERVAPHEPALAAPRLPTARKWKLKATLALTGLIATALFASLVYENSYVARTRMGMSVRRLVLGRSGSMTPRYSERQLTANPDDAPVTSSVLSPDGKYLAYTDKTGFYLRLVGTGETHAVNLPKGFEPLAESWFPDSVHLVVSWVANPKESPGLWVISLLGGTPRKLIDKGESARVSPDGSKVAFLAGKFGCGEVWLMQADGNDPKRIAGGSPAEADDWFGPVAWTPDGQHLSFVRLSIHSHGKPETTLIQTADISNGRVEDIISKPGAANMLAWTNEGLIYSFLEQEPPNAGDFDLWLLKFDPRTGKPLASSPRLTTGGKGWITQLSVSSDGRLVALRRSAFQQDVYISNLFGDGKRLRPPKRLTLDDRFDAVFSWTADSKAVLFLSNRDGPIHLFKQDIDQAQPELLVGGNDDLGIPRLNPSGTEVLYMIMPKDGQAPKNVRIMRVPLKGGPPQLVTEAQGIWNFQCARLPSTLCLYTAQEMNHQRFFAFAPLTGQTTELTLATVKGGWVNWNLSPDGKSLAITKIGSQQKSNIRIVDLGDGSERVIPLPEWEEIGSVDWAPDGKSIWVSAMRQRRPAFGTYSAQSIVNVNLNGKVTESPDTDAVWFAAIPSPDGLHLALPGATENSNVWLLEHF